MKYHNIMLAVLLNTICAQAMDVYRELAQSSQKKTSHISPALQAFIKHGILCERCYQERADFIIDSEATFGKQLLVCQPCASIDNYKVPVGGLITKIKNEWHENGTDTRDCELCYEPISQTTSHLNGTLLTCCATQDACKILCPECSKNSQNLCPYCRKNIKILAIQRSLIDTISTEASNPTNMAHIAQHIYKQALREDNVTVVRTCLENGIKPDNSDLFRYGNFPILKLLIQHGAPINAKNAQYGHTPLINQLRNFKVTNIAYLLHHGANVRSRDYYLSTPLHCAVHGAHPDTQRALAIVELLMAYDPDCNAQDSRGNTPLHYACCKGGISMVRELLSHGADAHIQNIDSESPFDIAKTHCTDSLFLIMQPQPPAKQKQPSALVKILRQLNDGTVEPTNAIAELINACDKQAYGYLFKRALEKKSYPYISALFAYAYEQPESHIYLQELLANPEIRLDDIASFQGLTKASTSTHVLESIDCLVQRGANINSQSSDGLTPLHFYVKQNKSNIIQYLLSRRARTDIETPFGRSALHWAQSKEIALALIQQDEINLNAQSNNSGLSPLHMAVINNYIEVAQVLLERGASPNTQDKHQHETPLHLAVTRENIPMIQLLLKHDADVTIGNYQGRTPTNRASTEEIRSLLTKNIAQ